MRRRGERPGHSATTAHFQAAYPFLGMGGLGAPGVYVGTDAFGGAWAFDPWELYARRIMRSPNVIVLGGISYAKSILIKTYIYRRHLFGRQAWVIDVKGEYGPLAAALGRRTIRHEPGGVALALQRLCDGALRGIFDGRPARGSTSTGRWSSSTSRRCATPTRSRC
jgi:hypothetical protein